MNEGPEYFRERIFTASCEAEMIQGDLWDIIEGLRKIDGWESIPRLADAPGVLEEAMMLVLKAKRKIEVVESYIVDWRHD